MSERSKPKKLLRERAAQIARLGLDPAPVAPPVANPSTIGLCRHDVPWRSCTVCSKPVIR